MENAVDIKALYIVVNAGFEYEAMEIARKAGAQGATIINARGGGASRKAFLGITVDSEKEILLIITDDSTAQRIMDAIKEKAGSKSPANSICFTLPVEKIAGISRVAPGPG